MILFVGLGNPGAKYAQHRHNIGFMAADAIAEGYSFGPWKARFQGVVAEGRIAGEKVLLLKPSTYMNESGRSVGEAMRYFKLTSADIVTFHDELAIDAGKVKAKKGGGHAGHNGLRSMDAHIGNDYARVRLGIGHPGDKTRVHNHVLGDFSKAEEEWLTPLLHAVAAEAGWLARRDIGRFTSALALKLRDNGATDSKEI